MKRIIFEYPFQVFLDIHNIRKSFQNNYYSNNLILIESFYPIFSLKNVYIVIYSLPFLYNIQDIKYI